MKKTVYNIAARFNQPLTVAHLSDIHGKFRREILDAVKAAKPDIIAVTGDLAEGDSSASEESIRFIGEHITEPLDAAAVAGHFHLSKSYVQNLFSEQMHIGLKKYVMQKKIYAAEGDIRHGLSPTAAAEKYAFSDYSVFYRLYKKTFGKAPREKSKN